jgi:hypothetical protein
MKKYIEDHKDKVFYIERILDDSCKHKVDFWITKDLLEEVSCQ